MLCVYVSFHDYILNNILLALWLHIIRGVLLQNFEFYLF